MKFFIDQTKFLFFQVAMQCYSGESVSAILLKTFDNEKYTLTMRKTFSILTILYLSIFSCNLTVLCASAVSDREIIKKAYDRNFDLNFDNRILFSYTHELKTEKKTQ